MSTYIHGNPLQNTYMEGVHEGYLKTIVSYATCDIAFYKPDNNGIDAKISRRGTLTDIGLQLKATTDWKFSGSDLLYELDVNAYNQLVGYSQRVPSFLGLMIYPKLGDSWHQVNEGDSLVIRHTMYWEFLGGRPLSTNSQSVSLRIPRRKLLTAPWLGSLFTALRTGKGLRNVLT